MPQLSGLFPHSALVRARDIIPVPFVTRHWDIQPRCNSMSECSEVFLMK